MFILLLLVFPYKLFEISLTFFQSNVTTLGVNMHEPYSFAWKGNENETFHHNAYIFYIA